MGCRREEAEARPKLCTEEAAGQLNERTVIDPCFQGVFTNNRPLEQEARVLIYISFKKL